MGKGEIARNEQFLLFPQYFQKACFPEASKGNIVWEWVKPHKDFFLADIPSLPIPHSNIFLVDIPPWLKPQKDILTLFCQSITQVQLKLVLETTSIKRPPAFKVAN